VACGKPQILKFPNFKGVPWTGILIGFSISAPKKQVQNATEIDLAQRFWGHRFGKKGRF